MNKEFIRTSALILAMASAFSAVSCGEIGDDEGGSKKKRSSSQPMYVIEDDEDETEEPTADETAEATEDETETAPEEETVPSETAEAATVTEMTTEPDIPVITETPAEPPSGDVHLKIGEPYVCDDMFILTITGVKETSYRNEYSSKTPKAVYEVSYTYSNIGYTNSFGEGLYLDVTDMIVDSTGMMGYEYSTDTSLLPSFAPVGTTCSCVSGIGVDNPGSFDLVITSYDKEYNKKTATITVDVNDHNTYAAPANPVSLDTSNSFHIGETWTVPGQWEMTITGVEMVSDRSNYIKYQPAAAYKVSYTYKNLGYESNILDGLYLDIDETSVSSTGYLGHSYNVGNIKYPQETPKNAACNAEAIIGLDAPGEFNIVVNQYDSNSKLQSAVFTITP